MFRTLPDVPPFSSLFCNIQYAIHHLLLLRRVVSCDLMDPLYSPLRRHCNNPKDHTLNLSQNVYGSRSIAAIGVAAHECGHAIQHAEGYVPLSFRSAIVPVVSIGSTLSWPLILIGLLIPRLDVCITFGIILFSLVVVFQFVTLPVEFNASGRAIAILRNGGFMTEEELGGAKRVLTAAALTYVAAMVTAILQLVRLLLLTNRRR